MQFIKNFLDMFVSMSFYIMIGLLLVGILNTYINKDKILKHLGKNSFSSVIKASLIGVPLPLCSCGVIPTAIELSKNGASNGAVISFLISTPQTGVDSIFATYSLMGMFMAIYRPIAAFFSGILGGAFVNIFAKDKIIINEKHISSYGCNDSHNSNHSHNTSSSCCSDTISHCRCDDSHNHSNHSHSTSACGYSDTVSSCGCSDTSCDENSQSKFLQVFKYAYGKFLDEIALQFVLGVFIATIISTFLPVDFFANIGLSNGILAMLSVIVIGIPMYICSTSSIPIAISLVAKGLSYGSAFAFLFSGPVTNIASLLVLNKTLGKKITFLYITCVVFCSVGFGLLLDYIISAFNITINSVGSSASGHHSTFSIVVAIVFAILILKSLIKRFTKKTAKY